MCGMQIRVSKPPNRDWAAAVASLTQVPDPLLVSPELEDLEKDGAVVPRAQLQALATDPEIRQFLGAADLQMVVAAVDAAPCREAALAEAIENPTFAQFCDKVLDTVAPDREP